MRTMMTALNWDALRSQRTADRRDESTDFPPRTGSYRDQMRHGVVSSCRRSPSKSWSTAASATTQSRAKDHQQLQLYVDCAFHLDFRRKTTAQRAEILEIIRKLIFRCESWGPSSTKSEQDARAAAHRALNTCLH